MMKRMYLFILAGLLATTALSCKKDTSGEEDLSGLQPGKMMMKAGGVSYESEASSVQTLHDEGTNRYLVTVTGFFKPADASGTEDAVNLLHLYLNLSEAQFNNPKGTYDIVALENVTGEQSVVSAAYIVDVGLAGGRSYGIFEEGTVAGKLTITDYAINPSLSIVPGLPAGPGYTKIQGSFDVSLVEATPVGIGGTIAITEGKFNVKDVLAF